MPSEAIWKSMNKFEEYLRRAEAWVGLVGLASIIVLVFLGAVLRKLDHPLVWANDLAQLLFVWTAFIGADLTFQKRGHIGVDFIVRRFPHTVRWTVQLVMYLLIIAFLVPVGISGAYLGVADFARRYESLQISYSWATFSAPVGCLLLTRTAVIALVQHLRNPASAGGDLSADSAPADGK